MVAMTVLVLAGCQTSTPETPRVSTPIAQPVEIPELQSSYALQAGHLHVRTPDGGMQQVSGEIFFAFDEAILGSVYYPLLVQHADYLNNNPGQQILIEGHTDELGTREYNLALGAQRAAAVREFLIVNGVSRQQIETVSYGEEKPLDAGHYESAWKKNRRARVEYRLLQENG